jgi:hypothetical protein
MDRCRPPIAFRQQSVAQRGEERPSIVLRFLDRLGRVAVAEW